MDSSGCGTVEGFSAPAGRRVVPLADFKQLGAVGAELLNGVDAVIRAEQGVVMGNVQAVGTVGAEVPFSEGTDVVAVPVQYDDGLFTTG